jgi:hypothetical protein
MYHHLRDRGALDAGLIHGDATLGSTVPRFDLRRYGWGDRDLCAVAGAGQAEVAGLEREELALEAWRQVEVLHPVSRTLDRIPERVHSFGGVGDRRGEFGEAGGSEGPQLLWRQLPPLARSNSDRSNFRNSARPSAV